MAKFMAEEITWFRFRTVLALKPLGWRLASIRFARPPESSFLYKLLQFL